MKTLHCGDCLDVMRTMPDNSVDLVLTDPPYGLAFMGKKWDYDVPSEDVWAEALRVLKPGGHLLAFAGTRTQHRMACRIEDAGFEIRDMLAWLYGSGFPKSLDVSKAIDKAAGAVRAVVGPNPNSRPNMVRVEAKVLSPRVDAPITAPSTDAAREWDGWGTALKPALEPITMARKPLVGTVAANVLEHGTGALNIDECRVGTESKLTGQRLSGTMIAKENTLSWEPEKNLCDSCAKHVDNKAKQAIRATRECSAINSAEQTLNEKEKNTQSGLNKTDIGCSGGQSREGHDEDHKEDLSLSTSEYGARQTAMFQPGIASTTKTMTDSTIGLKICASCASAITSHYTSENTTQEKKSLQQGQSSNGNVAPGGRWPSNLIHDGSDEVVEMFPNASARYFYCAKASRAERGEGNNHPTVKPIALMEYLVKLASREGAIVLDPFMGSGTTGIACKNLGRQFIGIERDPDYFRIAEARINHTPKQMEIAG